MQTLDTYTTDKIVTVPVTTPTQQVTSVTNLTLFKVLEQAQKQADNMLEQDPTASRHFVACAKIYADLCALYYANAENDYISLQEIMHTIAEHLEYYDDLYLYTNIVADTAMQDVDMLEYTYLSN
jgi:hypothetical protein